MEIEKVEDFDYVIVNETSINELTKDRLIKKYLKYIDYDDKDYENVVPFDILYIKNEFETKKLSDIIPDLSDGEIKCDSLFKPIFGYFDLYESINILEFIAYCDCEKLCFRDVHFNIIKKNNIKILVINARQL